MIIITVFIQHRCTCIDIFSLKQHRHTHTLTSSCILHTVADVYTHTLIFVVLCCYTGTVAEGAPVVPISAQLKYNIEVVCEYIVKKIPIPLRDFISQPRLIGREEKRE